MIQFAPRYRESRYGKVSVHGDRSFCEKYGITVWKFSARAAALRDRIAWECHYAER